MHDPFLRSLAGNNSTKEFSSSDSWWNRVRGNLGQLLIPSHFKAASANGAPIHLLQFDKSPRPARAQGASLLTHAAVFAAILFLLTRVEPRPVPQPANGSTPLTRYPFPVFRTTAGANPSSGDGSGGNRSPIPATSGNLPARSSIQIVRPTLPENQNPMVPVPPTILDPNAAAILTPTEKLGLPWMADDTNSPGPGDKHGLGTGKNGTLGDGDGGPAGIGGSDRPFGLGFIPPGCAYCPYPTYTDEARHGKVQGSVTLAVLVGADGRAQDIRIVKGIGFGLDDRAVETVRGWKFTAARDAGKHSVAAWVTVEAVFRLF
jgi:periplasmic protein TonB